MQLNLPIKRGPSSYQFFTNQKRSLLLSGYHQSKEAPPLIRLSPIKRGPSSYQVIINQKRSLLLSGYHQSKEVPPLIRFNILILKCIFFYCTIFFLCHTIFVNFQLFLRGITFWRSIYCMKIHWVISSTW